MVYAMLGIAALSMGKATSVVIATYRPFPSVCLFGQGICKNAFE